MLLTPIIPPYTGNLCQLFGSSRITRRQGREEVGGDASLRMSQKSLSGSILPPDSGEES
jgi:hypothetical protein